MPKSPEWMGDNSEKEYQRKLSSENWIREMKQRAERGEFEPFTDLITEADYLQALERYFGNLETLRGRKYLDVGAGFGGTLHELLKRLGVEVINVDVSSESIKYLKEQGEKGLVATGFRLPFPEKSLDGIISVNLINTSAAMDQESVKDLFKEFNRVLKDKGHFIQSHYGYQGRTVITGDEQLEVLESSGFKNIQLIQNQLTESLSFLDPLTFIAEKEGGRE